MAFVGAERTALVEDLVSRFEAVSGSGNSMFVTLEGPTGWGKTRIIQEVYARLAESQSYWPPTLLPTDSEDPLQNRKWLYPKIVEPPQGAELPWMWWGVPCSRTDTGRPRQVITDEVTQLVAHHETLIRRSETKDLAKSALVSVASFATSILVPSVSDLLGIAQTSKELIDVAVHGSRRSEVGPIDADDSERADIVENTSQLLRLISNSEIPILLAIEDAHDADPSLLKLLERALLNPGKGGLLVVALGWGDEIVRQTRDDDDSDFGSWLIEFEERVSDLVTRIPLERLGAAELAELVREAAPNTRSDVVNALAERADGNPLVLTSLLEVDQVKLSIEDDAIGLTVEEVRELPHEYRSILQARWESLDREVQLALCLAATQGIDFVRELVVSSYDSLGRSLAGDEAIDQACDPIGWVRDIDKHLRFFEIYHYELATEGVANFLGRTKLDSIRRDLVDQIQGWEADEERWEELPRPTRQLLQMTEIRSLAQIELDFNDLDRIAGGVTSGRNLAHELQGFGRAQEILEAYEPVVGAARDLGALTLEEDARAWRVIRLLRREAGDLRGAHEAAKRMAEILVGDLGHTDRTAVEAEIQLAQAEHDMGHAMKALESLQSICSREQMLDSETRDWALHELAKSQWRLRLNEDALASVDQLLDVAREDAPRSRASYLNLRGLILDSLDRGVEAVEAQEEASRIFSAELGEAHLTSLQAQVGLGSALSYVGRTEEATLLLESTDAVLRERFGPLHPVRLNALGSLGGCHLMGGRPRLAVDLLLETYQGQVRLLGPAHHFSVSSLNNSLRALRDSGQTSQLDSLARSGTQMLLAASSDIDHGSSTELVALADVLSSVGLHELALEIDTVLLGIRTEFLPEQDQYYLASYVNHAAYLKRAGRLDEALKLESEWSPRCDEVLGEGHPLSVMAKRNLADSLRLVDRPVDAIPLVEQILEVQRSLPRPDAEQIATDERWLSELKESVEGD